MHVYRSNVLCNCVSWKNLAIHNYSTLAFNSLQPVRNSQKKQKPCTTIQRIHVQSPTPHPWVQTCIGRQFHCELQVCVGILIGYYTHTDTGLTLPWTKHHGAGSRQIVDSIDGCLLWVGIWAGGEGHSGGEGEVAWASEGEEAVCDVRREVGERLVDTVGLGREVHCGNWRADSTTRGESTTLSASVNLSIL